MDTLTKFKSLTQAEKLQQLKTWDVEYYEMDNPSITDTEYDACLKHYNETYKNPYESSLGKAKDDSNKYEHTEPVLSLDKIHTKEEFLAAIKKFDYKTVIQPKIDGLSIVLYPDGNVVSRGNGQTGEILPFGASLPAIKNYLETTEKKLIKPIRMEAVITKAEKENFFKNETKNSRNLAAGALRRKDYSEAIEHISCIAYDILDTTKHRPELQIEALKMIGFETPETIVTNENSNFDEIYASLKNFADNQPYPTDGIVIKANIAKDEKDFGMTSHHPLNAVALKFESLQKESTITDILWSYGKTGTVTPVAQFEPVILNDNEIRQATLHNLKFMNELNIRKGSKITVTLANEIIPQILASDGNGEKFNIPIKCEKCGCHLHVNESNALYCPNPDCGQKLLGDMLKIIENKGLNIIGVGNETLSTILENLEINNAFELLNLKSEQLEKTGLSQYEAKMLEAKLQKAKKDVPLPNFFRACNIPLAGLTVGKTLFAKYKDLNEFLEKFRDEGRQIEGIGDTLYQNICKNLDKIKENAAYIESFANNTPAKKDALIFVISGSLSNDKKKGKAYYHKLITDAGHTYKDNVTLKTSYLVTHETGTGKIQKANEYRIPIINEQELLKILGVTE